MSMGQYLNIMIADYIHILNPSLFYKQIIDNSKTILFANLCRNAADASIGYGKKVLGPGTKVEYVFISFSKMKYELAYQEPKFVTIKSLSHVYLQKVNMKEESESFLKKMLDHVKKKGGPYRMREHPANPNRRVSIPNSNQDPNRQVSIPNNNRGPNRRVSIPTKNWDTNVAASEMRVTTTLKPDREINRRPTPPKNMKMRQTSKNTPNPINNGSLRNSVLHGPFGDLLHKNKTALVDLGKDELFRPGIQLEDQDSDDNDATIITDPPQPLRSPGTKPTISAKTSKNQPSSSLRLRSSSGTRTNNSTTITTTKPPPLFTNNPLDQPTSEAEQDQIRYFSWP